MRESGSFPTACCVLPTSSTRGSLIGSSVRVGGLGLGGTHQVDAVHDADAEGHEGLGEVDYLFALCRDGEACDCQVSFL